MADSRTSDARTLGLLRIGEALLAIDVDSLQEVIPCPPRLHALPAVEAAVRGAVRLRGMVIPVFDVRQMLRLDGAAAAEQVVVLVRHEARLLGLLADGVQGTAQVGREQLRRLHVPGGGDIAGLMSHAFETDNEMAVVIDVPCLAALPGVPWVEAPPPLALVDTESDPIEPMLLFRSGPFDLAIRAIAIAATIPSFEPHDNAIRRDACLGTVESQGLEIPVVDLPAVLRLQPPPQQIPTPPAALLLKCGAPESRDRVALTIDHVVDIARVRRSEILARPATGLRAAHLFRGVLERRSAEAGPSTPYLVLDDEALAGDDLLRSLASLTRPIEGAASSAAALAAAGSATAVLTLDVDHEMAVPLLHVAEIVPLVDAMPVCSAVDGAEAGLFTHRGKATTLIDLARALGRPRQITDEHSRVLIVRSGTHQVGYIVRRLGTVDASRWSAPGAAGRGFDVASFNRRPPLIELGSGTTQRTLALLDLAQLTELLLRVAEPA